MAMGAVGRAAMAMIEEVRRQFKSIPELTAALAVMKKYGENDEWSEEDKKTFEAADGKAEYGKCVEISTQSAIKEMLLPGLLAILTPVAVGFVFWRRDTGRPAGRCDCVRGTDGHISIQCRRCLG